MTVYTIVFHKMEEILKFTDLMKNCKPNADLKSGNLYVDAKSLLGILGMGIHREMKLIIHDDVDEEWEKTLLTLMNCKPVKC